MSADLRTVARGAGWMLPATLLGNAFLLGLDLYVNGVLGNADYGLFNAVRRVLQLATFVVLLGMENAVIRAVAIGEGPGAVRFATLLTGAAGVIGGLLLVALAHPFAAWIDPAPATVVVLLLGAATLVPAALRTVWVSACQGVNDLRPRALVMFLAWPIVQFAGILALGRYGAVGAMGAYLLSMVVGAAVAAGFLVRREPAVLRPGAVDRGRMLAVAGPLWIQGILMAAYTWADQVLLAGLRSTEMAGIYGPVATLQPLYGVGLQAINSSFAPLIAQKHKDGATDELRRLYRVVTRWSLYLAMPPVAVSLVLPTLILSLWPHGSPEAATALRITALAQLFATGTGSVNYLLIMSGNARAVLWNGVPALIGSLAVSLLLIPSMGPTGAALASATAALFANGLALWQVWKLLGLHPFDLPFFRALGVGMLAFVPLVFVPSIVGAIACCFLYVGVLWALPRAEGDTMVIDVFARKLRR